MDILFIVPYVPNLVRVRPYNLIRALAARGHRLTVLTVWTDQREWQAAEYLKQYCAEVWAAHLPSWRSWWNCLQAVPSATPLQAVYCWQPKLLSRVASRGTSFDVVHVEHLRGARYGLAIKSLLARSGRPAPIVWDSVDCISLLFRQAAERSQKLLSRWMTRFELRRTERYEGWLKSQFDRVLVTSPADELALNALPSANGHTTDITVLPNGVDLDYFAPAPAETPSPATLVISGKMSYHANVTMALHLATDILPRVRSRRPDVKLQVVGKSPPREILALAQDPAITVTGTVGDVRPYLRRATVAAAPITYGAGIQNKVLEAMACGTPVVATPQAVSALNAQPGRDVLVAQEPQSFAEAVLQLIEHPRQRQAIGQAGRRYVETHHQWDTIAGQLERNYDEVIRTRS